MGSTERLMVFVLLPQIIILILVITFLWFLYSTNVVVGTSMLPTLLDGDRLLVAKSYNTPVRGDVIAFGRSQGGGQVGVIKRVIGVPGDVVEVRAGEAIVNGYSEDVSYEVFTNAADVSSAPLVVPEGELFVLGDNRPASADSRFFGTVPLETVVGRAAWIIWPPGRIGTVDGPRDTD